MQSAEYNHEDFDPRNQSKLDENLFVKFFYKVRPDKSNPGEFKEVEYIDIKAAGRRDGVARPATPADKERFPRHYAAFKERMAPPVEGTPLSEWSMVPRAMVERLTFINIKTVEQLATIADVDMPKEVAAMNLKQKAIDWLEAHKDEKFLAKMRGDLELRDKKIEEQAGTIEKLAGKVNELVAQVEKMQAESGG